MSVSDPLADVTDAQLELLSAYLEGDLDARERADLERALSTSPTLRAALGVMRRSRDAVRQHIHLQAPETLMASVLEAVEREPVPIRRAANWRRPLGVPIEIFAIAAAAVLVIGVGLRAAEVAPGSPTWTEAPSPASVAPSPGPSASQAPAPQRQQPLAKPSPVPKQGRVEVAPSSEGTADAPATSEPSAPESPGTVVGETTGWNYEIQTSNEDVIELVQRVAQKHGAKVTQVRGSTPGKQALWVDVPTGRVSGFDADLKKVGVVEGSPDTSRLQLNDSVRVMVTIQAPKAGE
jgi:hypothetical protein